METTRLTRVEKQIQKDLSEIFITLGRSLAAGKMLTVTRVRLTPDLGLAKAYISVFPSEASQAVVDMLNENVSKVRNELGQRIRHQVRKIPELKFFLDDSLDYIENINNLLKE
ncbi:MAG: 30S ribosome-binding factor RbfA [Bacteroidales bacterium]|nr:30S ribosome-binding factor RbfA [Bacteroidales bacterium]